MKIKGIVGEFAFQALVKYRPEPDSWSLTAGYFFSIDEVEQYYDKSGYEIKWPIECFDDGSIYIPSKEELEDEN